MLRKAVCAAAVLVFAFSVATAEEINGRITKIEDGKITVASKYDKETKKFAEEKSYPLAKDVKVASAKFNKEDKKIEAGEALQGGLKNERLQNIGERGVRAMIVTNGTGQVTEIRVFQGRKKKE